MRDNTILALVSASIPFLMAVVIIAALQENEGHRERDACSRVATICSHNGVLVFDDTAYNCTRKEK